MTRLGKRGRKTQLAALSVAAFTSVAMLATISTSSAANPAPQSKAFAAKATKDDSAKQSSRRPGKVNFRLLSINDFHGQLEPSTSSSSGAIEGTRAGGAKYLATHLRKLRWSARAAGRRPITVAAGDLIGATPLLSAAFHDEPTIEAMNRMKLEVASVGNHEFDEGWRELLRMQRGGCIKDGPDGRDNQNSCPAGRFGGADFQYLAANVFRKQTGRTVLPAVEIKRHQGVPVGFIGMTLENTPNIVTKAGVQGLRFDDEVKTANRVANQLYKRGVESVVVLVHEGGFPSGPGYNACPGVSGPIIDINNGLSHKIDVVLTGHTHQPYNCTLNDPAGAPRLVTSAASLGRVVSKIDLTVDRRTGEIDRNSAKANNVVVTQGVKENWFIDRLIDKYETLVAPIANEVIGELAGTTVVTETNDESGESPLGNLIADAQKVDSSLLAGGAAPEIAFMNPGGIRADLVANDAGEVTYGAAFATQPFNNYDVAMDLTGSQILALLEQQWQVVDGVTVVNVLSVSGIEYTYSAAAPVGSKVDRSTVMINGEPVDEGETYRVTANSFLSDGGDGFGVFADATNKYIGGLDIDALAEYLAANRPYTPVPTDRIDVE